MREDRLRAIPAPTQAELLEAQVESRLRAHESLERRPVLGNAGGSELAGENQKSGEERDGCAAKDGDAEVAHPTFKS